MGPAGATGATGEQVAPGIQGPQVPKGDYGDSGAVMPSVGHLLYLPGSGRDAATSLTYTLDTPVALADFDVTFFQERLFGTAPHGVSLTLGIDKDADGTHEFRDLDWHFAATEDQVTAALGDDTFVEMDSPDPDTHVKVTASGNHLWMATGSTCAHSSLATCAQLADKKVYVVRFVLGAEWQNDDAAVRVTAPMIEGTPSIIEGRRPAP